MISNQVDCQELSFLVKKEVFEYYNKHYILNSELSVVSEDKIIKGNY